MIQVKVHTFNFMFVCKAKVGVSVSVLENLSDFVYFYDIDKKKNRAERTLNDPGPTAVF